MVPNDIQNDWGHSMSSQMLEARNLWPKERWTESLIKSVHPYHPFSTLFDKTDVSSYDDREVEFAMVDDGKKETMSVGNTYRTAINK
jgi:hypothetical protein